MEHIYQALLCEDPRVSRYRICVVCTGNICRSPMAEYLLREAIDEAGLGDLVEVSSAGTSSEEHGNPIDPRTADALARHGHPDLGWDEHRARRFDRSWFDGLDLVLAADRWHERTLRRLASTHADRSKVALLRSFDPGAARDGGLDMDDPWYGGPTAFDRTHDEIVGAVPGLVDHVRLALGRHHAPR